MFETCFVDTENTNHLPFIWIDGAEFIPWKLKYCASITLFLIPDSPLL